MNKILSTGILLLLLCSCQNSTDSSMSSFPSRNTHNVTFFDYDGSILFSTMVEGHESAFYEGEEPTRKAPNTKTYYYDFYKWNQSLNNIDEDKEIKPIFHIIETKNPINRGDFTYRAMYEIENDNLKTIGYELYKYNDFDFIDTLIVPETFNNLPILRIGEACFMECNMKEVVLPKTIQVIDQYAFNSCPNLYYVNIPDATYSLKRAAFYYDPSLENLSLNNISFMREDNFHLCQKLNAFSVSTLNEQYMANDGILYSQNERILIKVPEGKKEVTIKDTTEKVKLESISRLANCNKIILPPSIKELEEKVFFESKLKEIQILGKIFEIPRETFEFCQDLETLDLPNTIKMIGARAFYNCRKLTDFKLPNQIETIGDFAFAYCVSLKEFYIPDALKEIGEGALIQLDSLQKFIIDQNNYYSVYDEALYSKDYSSLFRVPQTKTEVNIYSQTKIIKEDAFYWCSYLTGIDLPETIEAIEGYAFYFCRNIYELDIPDSVLSIGESAFEGMENLISIHLPSNLVILEDSLFENCALLQEVNIPRNVTKISNEVFYNCINLPTLTIYEGLLEFGKDVFAACNMLDDIYYTGSEDTWHTIKGLSICALTSETVIHYNHQM